ncbi:MAG: DUF3299 domain-containing protein [Planctomycetaceae bacterium]|nr:DUF3299 domain-containing protein [Planctomycetaceae bacterium]
MNHLPDKSVAENQFGNALAAGQGHVTGEAELYQLRSKSATLSLLFGIFASVGFIFIIFMALAPLAIVLGWHGLRVIRRYPEEYSGAGFAKLGLALGLISLVGGSTFHTAVYLTEVREGYERITFYADLKNKVEKPTDRAKELDGKKVFLKGYVRPGLRRDGLTEFLMVGDFGDCCFGGSPNLSEIVYIKMPPDQTTQYDFMLRKIHGTFRLNQQLQKSDRIANDVAGYIYQIDADYYN